MLLLFLIYYFFSFCNFIFAGPHWKPHVCEVGSLLKDLYYYYYYVEYYMWPWQKITLTDLSGCI